MSLLREREAVTCVYVHTNDLLKVRDSVLVATYANEGVIQRSKIRVGLERGIYCLKRLTEFNGTCRPVAVQDSDQDGRHILRELVQYGAVYRCGTEVIIARIQSVRSCFHLQNSSWAKCIGEVR